MTADSGLIISGEFLNVLSSQISSDQGSKLLIIDDDIPKQFSKFMSKIEMEIEN